MYFFFSADFRLEDACWFDPDFFCGVHNSGGRDLSRITSFTGTCMNCKVSNIPKNQCWGILSCQEIRMDFNIYKRHCRNLSLSGNLHVSVQWIISCFHTPIKKWDIHVEVSTAPFLIEHWKSEWGIVRVFPRISKLPVKNGPTKTSASRRVIGII